MTGDIADGIYQSDVARKQLTILFCDLVDSTELSINLDPEDFRQILATYQSECARVVHSFDGYISDFRGDGVIIYFGYPIAREDDVVRAALCALDLAERISKLDVGLTDHLQVRVGIATGLVVVGHKLETGRADVTVATGKAPYLAARLQALAEPNQIVISHETYTRLRDLFECKHTGSHQLKGFQTEQDVWQLGAPARLPNAPRADVTPASGLVGRTAELFELHQTWETIAQGHGAAVSLIGEAGIGKSLLMRTFCHQLSNSADPPEILSFACSSIFSQIDFFPFAAQVSKSIGIRKTDGPEARMAKLTAYASRWSELAQANASALFHLLELGQQSGYHPAYSGPTSQASATVEALVSFVLDRAESGPLVVIFEDLHWADTSSLAVISELIGAITDRSIMLVVTSRTTPALRHSRHKLIRLGEFDEIEGAALIAEAGGQSLSSDDVQSILEHADGVPLFIEEITKVVSHQRRLQSNGSGDMSRPKPLGIPPSLNDLLSARLDLLGSSKRVAQIASLLGRIVDRRLLSELIHWPRESLETAIETLLNEGIFVRDSGTAPSDAQEPQLLFRHSLIQGAAYESMLVRERVALHGRAMDVLAADEKYSVVTQLALLAYHAERAERFEQAIEHRNQLACSALSRSSLEDATANVKMAMALIDRLPPEDRAHRECGLQLVSGTIAVAAKGYASKETGEAFRQAKSISNDLNDQDLLAKANLGLAMYHLDSGEVRHALDLTEGLLSDAGLGATLPLVNRVAGTCNFLLGSLERSQRYLHRALSLIETGVRDPELFHCGADLRIETNSWLAVVLSLGGKHAEAEALAGQTITAAQELDHPYSLAYALGAAKVVYHYGNQVHLVEVTTDDLIALAETRGFPYFIETGRIYKGWVLVRSGRHDEGLAMMQDALEALRRSGTDYLVVEFHVLLADALLMAGLAPASCKAVADALAIREKSEVSFFDAEMMRMRAQSGLAAGSLTSEETATLLERAIETARSQQAHGILRKAARDLSSLRSCTAVISET